MQETVQADQSQSTNAVTLTRVRACVETRIASPMESPRGMGLCLMVQQAASPIVCLINQGRFLRTLRVLNQLVSKCVNE